MSSAVTALVNVTRKCSQKSGTFWFPWMDSHDPRTIHNGSTILLL